MNAFSKMNNDLKDILANSNKDIGNQQLMDYLSNHLSKEAEHEMEKEMAADPFLNDAVEGLQQVSDKDAISKDIQALNEQLKYQVRRNRNRKEKRKWKDQPFNYYAIATILILLFICFLVLRKHLHS